MIKSISKETFFSVDSLKLSWKRYLRSLQAEVKDHVGIDSFGWDFDENIKRLHEKIVENKYQPSQAFKFKVPKPNRMQRTLTLLQVEDAIVYQAFANNIATDAYNELKITEDNSFGFSINDQVALGLDILKEENPDYYFYKRYQDQYLKYSEKLNENKLKYKLEADFTAFYDLIPHEFLFQYLNEKFISSSEILTLFKTCLKEWGGMKNEYNTFTGIPQTEIASPFFANIVLHELDLVMIEKGNPYYRYLDDILVFSDNEDELWETLVEIDNFAIERGMCINQQKTSVEKFSSLDLLEMEPSWLFEGPEERFFIFLDENIDRDNPYVSEETQEEKLGLEYLEECIQGIFDDYGLVDKIRRENEILSKNQLHEIEKTCFRIKKGFEVLELIGAYPSLTNEEFEEIHFNMFLELLSKYFWKSKVICNVLSCYEQNDDLKKGMLKILYELKHYEWVVYHVAKGLYKKQKLEKAEIDDLLLYTGQTDSWFSKSFLYPLMLKNCESNSQQLSIVKNNLFKEGNQQVLKNVIFNKYIESNKFFTNSEIKEILRRN